MVNDAINNIRRQRVDNQSGSLLPISEEARSARDRWYEANIKYLEDIKDKMHTKG